MQLSFVDALGFHFRNNGRLVKQNQFLHTYLTSNSLVQIKPTIGYFNLYLMKLNDTVTNNELWKQNNKYKYLDSEIQIKYGNSNQRPSAVNNKILKVFMLRNEVAEQFLKTSVLTLTEREYKDISLIIKPEFNHNFRYEFQYKTIQLPDAVPQKQVNDLVKVGKQLIARPMRKVS